MSYDDSAVMQLEKLSEAYEKLYGYRPDMRCFARFPLTQESAVLVLERMIEHRESLENAYAALFPEQKN